MAVPGLTNPDVFVHVSDGVPAMSETWPHDRPASAQITYIVPWQDRFQVANELRGFFNFTTGLGLPAPPHAYPPSPNLRLHDMTIRPHKSIAHAAMAAASIEDRPWIWPKHALIEAEYRVPDWTVDEDSADESNQIDPDNPIVGAKQSIKLSNAFMTLDNAQLEIMKADGDPQEPRKIIETSDGLPNNQVEFTLEFPRVARVPWAFLRPFVGKVNDSPMFGLDPEHLLFAGVDTQVTSSLEGNESSVTLTFMGSVDVSWNERLDEDGVAKPTRFVLSSGERPPFESVRLQDIFA